MKKMKKLTSTCGDWTAKEMLMIDFRSLEESIREFGYRNFAIANDTLSQI